MRDRVRGLAADVGIAALLAAVTGVLLWDSLRPGRTLVPADIITAVTPYRLLAGGFHPENAVVSDAAFQFFPWFHYLGDALRDGGVPGWNPMILGGLPMTPNGFVSTWYPAFWLVRWFDAYDAYGLFVALHLWWGALGVYAFSRVLGARRTSAVVVAASTLLAGTWLHWSLHLVHLVGMVWLPWGLAATHRLVERPRPGRAAALAVVFALWWLGGNPQYAYFGTMAMGVYAVVRIVQRREVVRPVVAFAGAVAVGALLAAPVLVPSARIGSTILRDREPAGAMADNHHDADALVRFIVPDARGNYADDVAFRTNTEAQMDSPFFGVTAIVLVGAGLAARGRGWGRARWALAGIAVVVTILAMSGWPHRLLYEVIPGYDRFRVGARWLSVLPAVALPIAALGLDALVGSDVADRRRARLGAVLAASLAGATVLGWWLWERGVAEAPHAYFGVRALVAAILVALAAAAAVAAIRWPRVAVAVVTVCVAFELAFHVPRWFPSIVERRAYPDVAVARIAADRGGRVARAGNANSGISTFSSDIPMVYGIDDAQGQTVMFPRDYDRYLRLIDDYGDWAKHTNVAPDIQSPAGLQSPLLDLLDVRTIVAESNVTVPGSLPALDPTGEPRVYANPGARPAMVVPSGEPVTTAEMWRAIADPGWDPTRTAHVIGLARPVAGGGGTVRGGRDGVDRERWDVDAPDGGVLRVSGRYADGWTATVDGEDAPVLRADGVFRAVVVPPGRHTVSFEYDNPDERTGARVAIVGLAALLLMLVVHGAWRDTDPDGGGSRGRDADGVRARWRRQSRRRPGRHAPGRARARDRP